MQNVFYLHTKWRLNPPNRLVTTDMGRKLGCVPLLGETGCASNTMWPGLRPTSMPTFILIDPCSSLATKNMGRKLGEGGSAPFLERGSWVPI